MSLKTYLILTVCCFLTGLISCSSNSVEKKKSKSEIKKETEQKTDSILPRQETPDLFPELILLMKNAGFNPDTTYFDERMYQEGEIHLVNYESHDIHEMLIDKNNFGTLSKKKYSADFDTAFSKATDIRLFPWAKMTDEGKKRFGVVEVWTFGKVSETEFVYQFLSSEKDYLEFPYPETGPLYFQCYNRLYIFHSPDSGAGVECRPFVDWLSSSCN